MKREQYKILAKLFQYPQEGYHQDVKTVMEMLQVEYPEAAKSFQRFYDLILCKNIHEIEEVFGITFHIQAICFLDLGYVLFGEDYKRGEFLVQMKKEQIKIGHNHQPELADNLPHVLFLMSKSSDDGFVQELAVRVVIPSLEKMLNDFESGRMALKAKIIKKKQKAVIMEDVKDGNIYKNALQTVLKVVQSDYKGVDYHDEKIEQSLSNFIPGCGTDSCTSSPINEPLKNVKS